MPQGLLARAPPTLLLAHVIRRVALSLALLALPCVGAPAPVQADLSADQTLTDYGTGDTVARGNARLVDSGFLLTADEIRFNQKTQVATASSLSGSKGSRPDQARADRWPSSPGTKAATSASKKPPPAA